MTKNRQQGAAAVVAARMGNAVPACTRSFGPRGATYDTTRNGTTSDGTTRNDTTSDGTTGNADSCNRRAFQHGQLRREVGRKLPSSRHFEHEHVRQTAVAT